MPIRINLLAEAKAEEEARRKDPVKRAVLGAVVAVVAVLVWSSTLQFKIIVAKSELNNLQSQWKSLEKHYEQVVASQRAFLETQDKLAALQKYTTNRFLWGTALGALPQVMDGLEEVQLIRLKTDQIYTVVDEAKMRSGPAPGAPPPKDPTATERIQMTFDAIDSGAMPGVGNVNSFRAAIAQVPFFQNSLKKTNGVQLTSLSAPTTGAGNRKPFVTFTVQCFFAEKVR